MLQPAMLLGFTLIWARVQPEIFYGIIRGCPGEELKNLKSFPLRRLMLHFGFESGLILILLHMLKGFLFILVMRKYLQAELWQQWLCFCLFTAGSGLITSPSDVSFWRRWSTYMGSMILLCPELAQLSLAALMAATFLSRRKKTIVWSNFLAALVLAGLGDLPPPIGIIILITCWLTSADFSFNQLKMLVNTAIKTMASPKHSLD